MNIAGNAQVEMNVSGVKSTPAIDKQIPVQLVKPIPSVEEILPTEITKQDARDMVDALRELTTTLSTTLNFSVDEGTNNIVVKVIDRDTEKIIKQIPPENMLKLAEKMQDLTGFLLSDNI